MHVKLNSVEIWIKQHFSYGVTTMLSKSVEFYKFVFFNTILSKKVRGVDVAGHW